MSATPITDRAEQKWTNNELECGGSVYASDMRELEALCDSLAGALRPIAELIGPDELPHLPPSAEFWIRWETFLAIYAALSAFDRLQNQLSPHTSTQTNNP